MAGLASAYHQFEQAFPSLLSLVARRIRVEAASHGEFHLDRSAAEVLEYATLFGRLLRIIYRHGLLAALRNELPWYVEVFQAHGWGQNGVSLLLTSWIVAIQGLIKPPECNLLAAPLQELADDLPRRVAPAATTSATAPTAEPDQEFLDAVLAGDADRAWQRLHIVSPGAPADRLVVDRILPALSTIGMQWERHRLEIFAEHLATQAIQRILDRLAVGLPRAPSPSGSRVALLACPPGDSHTLIPLALSVFLAAQGWQTRNLGGGLPAGQIAAAAQALRPQAVFLTMPLLLQLDAVLEVVGLLRHLQPAPSIVVGGPGSRPAREVLERAGALVATHFAHGHDLAIAALASPADA